VRFDRAVNFDPDAFLNQTVGQGFVLRRVVQTDELSATYLADDGSDAVPVHARALLGVRPPPASFEREALRVAAARHDNLAATYGTARLPDGRGVILQAPVQGARLPDQFLFGPFGLREVLLILAGVLDGLQAAHDTGVLHRDVRPAHLVFDPAHTADAPGVRLHRAGHAQLFGGISAPTLDGVIYGHPLFTAPEQWVNRPADARTDVYAVAMLGFVMLEAKHFIASGDPLQVCRQHMRGVRPNLYFTASGQTVPTQVAAALRRAADPDPERRFPSAAALAEVLRGALVGLGPDEDLEPTLTLDQGLEESVAEGSLNLDTAALEALMVGLDDDEDDELLDDTVFDDPPDFD
jgi:eukaryotic-like serine/threonine-protein kinase